jgi:hypothetical protein
MKNLLFLVFLFAILLPSEIVGKRHNHKKGKSSRHLRNNKHRRNHKHRRSLRRKIDKEDDSFELKNITEATKLGFKQGLEYAKKHAKKLRVLDDESHEGLSQDWDDSINHFKDNFRNHDDYHKIMAWTGVGGLAAGTISRSNKEKHVEGIQKVMKAQFAFKDSVIGMLTKEIQDLKYLNDKLSSSARVISNTQNNMVTKLQTEIFQYYGTKNNKK